MVSVYVGNRLLKKYGIIAFLLCGSRSLFDRPNTYASFAPVGTEGFLFQCLNSELCDASLIIVSTF